MLKSHTFRHDSSAVLPCIRAVQAADFAVANVADAITESPVSAGPSSLAGEPDGAIALQPVDHLSSAELVKLISEERTARRSAEEANRVKDRFISALSHNLRTPLTPVLLGADLIEAHPALPGDLREIVATMRAGVEHQSRLLDELLGLVQHQRSEPAGKAQQLDVINPTCGGENARPAVHPTSADRTDFTRRSGDTGDVIATEENRRWRSSGEVLLVEDNPATVSVMKRLLIMLGHRVQVAGSVAMARFYLSARRFDLMICDIGLPDGRGCDVLQNFNLDDRPPAIALTGYGTDDDRAATDQAGFKLHLVKPICFDQLKEAIAAAWRKE